MKWLVAGGLLIVLLGLGVYVMTDREGKVFKKVTKLIHPFLSVGDIAGRVSEAYEGDLGVLIKSPQWSWYHAEQIEPQMQGATLSIQSRQESVWWKNWRGPGLFSSIEGDFDVWTRVRTRSQSGDNLPLNKGFQFAGLIFRDPKSHHMMSSENYVFNVIGHRGQYGKQVETKSTQFGWSSVQGHDWTSGDADLRVQREGARFSLYAREIGQQNWQLMTQYERPDLPETLQIGIISYAFDYWSGYHDLNALFDYIVISP